MTKPRTNADIIVAAGDIGVYDQGIAWLKKLDKPVIYVAGNHEFYADYQGYSRMLKTECANTNIHFLEIIVSYIRRSFLGVFFMEFIFIQKAKLNDFQQIRFTDARFIQASAAHQQS